MSKRPPRAEATDGFGGDSFLDVIANMVGVMIILVVLTGLRASHAPAKSETVAPPQPTATIDLAPLETEVNSLKADVLTVYNQTQELNDLAKRQSRERDALALVAAAQRRQLEDEQAKLADGDRAEFDLQRAVESERVRLASLERDLQAAVEQPEQESVKIKTYPTPLSRTVHGREAHFQIKDNRIVYVPLEELIDIVKREIEGKAHRTRDLDETVETVGPIGGFRLRYTLSKIRTPPKNGLPAATVIALTELTLVPVAPQVGETLDEANRPDSQFQRTIADLDPRRMTITFWAYPESFAMYRTLREQLYERGYSVAGRPLPTGQPISGSPFGSKSSAQ